MGLILIIMNIYDIIYAVKTHIMITTTASGRGSYAPIPNFPGSLMRGGNTALTGKAHRPVSPRDAQLSMNALNLRLIIVKPVQVRADEHSYQDNYRPNYEVR